MDSQGIFFYEPKKNLSKLNYDLSYIIQLEDIISLKINEKVQKSGKLFNLLIEKRVVSLTENFSDRLLNIMGNFFSKIGTEDIRSEELLDLYVKTYPDSFFMNENKFNNRSTISK